MKQTAVEWLAQEMDYLIPSDKELIILQIVNKAKEIEKQQQGYSEEDMKRAFCNGGQLDYSALTSTKFGTKLLNKWLEQFKKK
jgi:hypothetical protein